MDIKDVFLRSFISFLRETLIVEQLNPFQIKNLQMNLINQLLESFKKGKICSSFKDNIWVLILKICNE